MKLNLRHAHAEPAADESRIVREAGANNYRLPSLILGVTQSAAFRSARAETTK